MCMKDHLNQHGKCLSLDEFNEKCGLKTNYLQYFQITVAIPSLLKETALLTSISTPQLLYLSDETTLFLSKIRFKTTITNYLMSALCRKLPG